MPVGGVAQGQGCNSAGVLQGAGNLQVYLKQHLLYHTGVGVQSSESLERPIKIICYNILTTVIHPHELPPPPLPQPKDAPHAVRNHGSVFWPNRTSHRSFGYRWSGKLRPTYPKRTVLPHWLLQSIRILHAIAAHNTPSSPPHHRKLPIRHLHSVQLLCFAGTCQIARI